MIEAVTSINQNDESFISANKSCAIMNESLMISSDDDGGRVPGVIVSRAPVSWLARGITLTDRMRLVSSPN